MRIRMAGVLMAVLSVGLASAAAAAARAVPLIEAVKRGDTTTVRTLVAQAVNVNATEPDGTTALNGRPISGTSGRWTSSSRPEPR